jgi:hypothetical protein
MMKNIFKKLTGNREVTKYENCIVVKCDDEIDREFLAIEINEFCYKKDIITDMVFSDLDNTLTLDYTL